jgi:hypothetical protein
MMWPRVRARVLVGLLLAVMAALGAAPAPAAAARPLQRFDRDEAAMPGRFHHLLHRSAASPDRSAQSPSAAQLCNSIVQWFSVATPVLPGDGWFNSVSGSSSADVWAVGAFTQSPGASPTHSLIEHYDGTSWTQDEIPDFGTGDNEIYSVSAYNPFNVWAAGYYRSTPTSVKSPLLVQLYGGRWLQSGLATLGSGSSRALAVDVASPTDVWVAGYGRSAADDSSPAYPQVWHYDGSSITTDQISPTTSADTVAQGVSAVTIQGLPDTVYLGGYSFDLYGHGGPYPEQPVTWNWIPPSTWSRNLASDDSTVDEAILGLSSRAAGNDRHGPFAVGAKVVNGYDVPLAWTSLVSPTTAPTGGTGNNDLYGLAAQDGQDVWGVGTFQVTPGSRYAPLFEHWDGKSWAQVAQGAPEPSLDYQLFGADAVSPTAIWAAGQTHDPSSGAFSPFLMQLCYTPPDGFTVTVPPGATQEQTTTVTVTATKGGQTMTSYQGSITFTGSDPQTILPSAYQFQPSDAGVHTFNLTYNGFGQETVSVKDADSSATGTTGAVAVAETRTDVASAPSTPPIRGSGSADSGPSTPGSRSDGSSPGPLIRAAPSAAAAVAPAPASSYVAPNGVRGVTRSWASRDRFTF